MKKLKLEAWSHSFTIFGVIISAVAILLASLNYSRTVIRENEARAVELYNDYLKFNLDQISETRETTDSSRLKYLNSYIFNSAESIYLLTRNNEAWEAIVIQMICDNQIGENNIIRHSIAPKFKEFIDTETSRCIRELW